MAARRAAQLLQRRGHGAALRVPEHDDEPRVELLGGELDAADQRRRDDVAGDADDEEIAEALIEHELGGHTRIGAAEDDRERLLAVRDFRAAPGGLAGAAPGPLRHKPPIALP